MSLYKSYPHPQLKDEDVEVKIYQGDKEKENGKPLVIESNSLIKVSVKINEYSELKTFLSKNDFQFLFSLRDKGSGLMINKTEAKDFELKGDVLQAEINNININLADCSTSLIAGMRIVVNKKKRLHEKNAILWEKYDIIIGTGLEYYLPFVFSYDEKMPPWYILGPCDLYDRLDDPVPPFIINLNKSHPIIKQCEKNSRLMKSVRKQAIADCFSDIIITNGSNLIINHYIEGTLGSAIISLLYTDDNPKYGWVNKKKDYYLNHENRYKIRVDMAKRADDLIG